MGCPKERKQGQEVDAIKAKTSKSGSQEGGKGLKGPVDHHGGSSARAEDVLPCPAGLET